MKNFLLIIFFVTWVIYYFVPYELKVNILETVWIDSSIIEKKVSLSIEKWEVFNLEFDDISHKILFSWNIAYWEIISDLLWASKPYVKCFYPENYNSFQWNTVHHRIVLWKNKKISVKLIQNNQDKNLSMYVYKTDAFSKIYPPEKEYVFDCKSDYSSNIEKIINMKGNTVTSDIVIWVTWWTGVLDWEYTLEIEEL